jgi:hypothetical protein
LDTGRQLSRFNSVIAAITLVHHAVSRKGRKDVQVQANAGLSLRDVPWAHGAAFGATQADIRINSCDPVFQLSSGAPWAQIRAGGILAVHAAPRKRKRHFTAVNDNGCLLDEHPVIWRETIADISLFGPIRYLDLTWIHLGKRLFGIGKFRLVDLFARLDTGPASDAFRDIDEGGQFFRGRAPDSGRQTE